MKIYLKRYLIVIFILLFLTSCNKSELGQKTEAKEAGDSVIAVHTVIPEEIEKGNTENINENYTPGNENITINDLCFVDKNINIRYPCLSHMSNTVLEESINDILKKQAFAEFISLGGNSEKITLELNFRVMYTNKSLLSIKYFGSVYYEGAAYPRELSYTVNINLLKGYRLQLKDFLKINKNFVNILRSVNIPAENELASEAFDYFNKNYSDDDIIYLLNNADSPYEDSPVIYSYFNKELIGLIIAVPHVTGDVVELQIKWSDLKSLKSGCS
ncbi:hypothetical protein IZU99_08000 [Oscillospiraceae bacterium CM]|nr:hypothetical protein IZU99_08000 [Oscillospiraceae bacterium CM]